MIDVVWGDPLLNDWERRFTDSLANFGWRSDYTNRQASKLEQIYTRLRRIRTAPPRPTRA